MIENKSSGTREVLSKTKSGKTGFPYAGVVLGIIVLAFLAASNPSTEMFTVVPGPDLAWTIPPVGAILPMIILTLLRIVLRKILGRSFCTAKDVVVAYGMIYIGGLVISRGFFSYHIVSIMYPGFLVVLARERRFREWFDRLLSIAYPKSEEAILGFWRGSSQVPWKEWIMPILAWSSFVIVFAFVILCLYTIVRRQWEEREHLTYPLANMVLGITEARDSVEGVSFWNNRMLWIGVLLSGIFISLPSLHAYFPTIPSPVTQVYVGNYVENPILKQAWMAYPEFILFYGYPLTVGIGYLIPTDLSFSLWFLYLLRRGICYIFFAYRGWLAGDAHMHAEVSETAGAYITLGVVYLWYARHDLKQMLTKAFAPHKAGHIDDSGDPLSFRTAIIGGLLGTVYLVAFSSFVMFASVSFALLYYLMFFGAVITSMRFRAEAGIPTTNMFGQKLMAPILETFGIERPNQESGPLAISLNNQWFRANMYAPFAFGPFGIIGSVAADQLKMATETGISRKGTAKALILAVAVATILAFVLGLPTIYKHGALLAGSHYQFMGSRTVEIFNPWGFAAEPKYWNLIPTLVLGAGGTLLVSFLRANYVWWPIHPVAYALSTANFLWILAFPMLIAWCCKTAILRWGGPVWYKKLIPLFMGLIVGQVMAQSLWAAVGFVSYILR